MIFIVLQKFQKGSVGLAQLVERQTEDLQVPCSIHGTDTSHHFTLRCSQSSTVSSFDFFHSDHSQRPHSIIPITPTYFEVNTMMPRTVISVIALLLFAVASTTAFSPSVGISFGRAPNVGIVNRRPSSFVFRMSAESESSETTSEESADKAVVNADGTYYDDEVRMMRRGVVSLVKDLTNSSDCSLNRWNQLPKQASRTRCGIV